MSHHHIIQLSDQLTASLETFEKELNRLGNIQTRADLEPLIQASIDLRNQLTAVKRYFVEVRSKLSTISGIPPVKELAQLAIGGSTEALSALRELLHYLEEYKNELSDKPRSPQTREELHYIDFSTREVIHGTRYVIKRIMSHSEDLPAEEE